jgi:hypothetical protein
VNGRGSRAAGRPCVDRFRENSGDYRKPLSGKRFELRTQSWTVGRDGRAIIEMLLATEFYEFPAYRRIC